MLDRLTFDDFKDYRGATFALEGAGGNVEMRLLDVRLSPYPQMPTRRRAFAILFTAPREPSLANRMYNIRHPAKGLMEGVFITPIAPPPQFLDQLNDVRIYEAVFN
ncbi:MAG: hypothetical protein MEP57_09115 [Microvirga sp.]|nr:hypothetical protein [Microvirga sp.]